MTAKVTFKPKDPEHVFDFAFEKFSKEPVADPRLTSATPVEQPSTPRPAPAPIPDAAVSTSSSGVDPALVPVPIPETVPEMLTQLRTRTEQIKTFIDRGAFASIYVPAFQAKDLALALDERTSQLSGDRRKIMEPAVARLVRSAYLLDAFGDLGNKQQIVDAFRLFSDAVKDIEASFAQGQPR